jgi:hypothetical protein
LTQAVGNGRVVPLMTPPPRSNLPRTIGLIMGALLLGLVIGNSATKADLRHAREEVEKLRRELATRGNNPTGINGIASILNLPEAHKPGAATRRHENAHQDPTPALPLAATQSIASATTGTGQTHRAHATLRKQLETASELWKTRVDLARNSFLSNVSSSDEHAVQFDVIMAAMNLRLSNDVSQSVAAIKTNQAMSAESGLRMLHTLSGDIVQAYQDLDQAMPDDWRGKAGAKFAVFDFINPDVVLPLTELDGAMKKKGNRGRDAYDTGDDSP